MFDRKVECSQGVELFSGKSLKRLLLPSSLAVMLSVSGWGCASQSKSSLNSSVAPSSSSSQSAPAARTRGGVAPTPARYSLVDLRSVVFVPPFFSGSARLAVDQRDHVYQLAKHVIDAELSIETPTLTPEQLSALSMRESSVLSQLQQSFGRDSGKGLLVMRISRFEERQGSRIGSDSGAALAFDLVVLRLSDGAAVWQKSYAFTDTDLASNLLSLGSRSQRGGRGWVSVDDLLTQGLKETLSAFEQERLTQYTAK